MENFTILSRENKSSHYEKIEYYAVDKSGKEIFAARAEITRSTSLGDMEKWGDWQINYGTCGAMSYEEKLPYVAAINAAMEKLRELSAK